MSWLSSSVLTINLSNVLQTKLADTCADLYTFENTKRRRREIKEILYLKRSINITWTSYFPSHGDYIFELLHWMTVLGLLRSRRSWGIKWRQHAGHGLPVMAGRTEMFCFDFITQIISGQLLVFPLNLYKFCLSLRLNVCWDHQVKIQSKSFWILFQLYLNCPSI